MPSVIVFPVHLIFFEGSGLYLALVKLVALTWLSILRMLQGS